MPLTESVSVSQFRDNRNRVQARILCQSRRDDLERLGECLETVRLFTLQRLRVLREHTRQVDLWRAASDNQRSDISNIFTRPTFS